MLEQTAKGEEEVEIVHTRLKGLIAATPTSMHDMS